MKDEKRQALVVYYELIKKSEEDLSKKKDDLAKKLLAVENELLETRYKMYISQLEGFIHTKYGIKLHKGAYQ
jgi:ribosomal protein L29